MRTRYLLAPALLAGAFTLSAQAQPDGLIKQQEALQSVAMQKVEKSIRDAVADAQKLQAAGSTARASERLRSAMRLLDDPILPRKNVDAWRDQLASAIRTVEAGKKPEVGDPTNPNKEAEIARVKAMIEEDKEIRRGVDTVASLLRGGDVTQAKNEVEALGKRFPTNPTVLVLPNLITHTMTL